MGDPANPFRAFVDPVDGSLCCKLRGPTMGMPFGTCITVVKSRPDGSMRFSDIQAAGLIDLRSGVIWLADRNVIHGRMGISVRDRNGRWAHPQPIEAKKLDLGKMPVIAELYYPEMREKAFRAFRGEKGYLRSLSGAAIEMAYVASGQVALFFCDRQKQDVGGTGYAFVKGAGGFVCDFDGNLIDDVPYTFRNPDGALSQTPMILAGNEALARELLARLKNG